MPEIDLKEIEVKVVALAGLVEKATQNAEAKNKEATEEFNKSLASFKEAQEKGLTDQMEILQKQMQSQYDEFVTKGTERSRESGPGVGIDDAMKKSLDGIKFVEQQDNDMTEELRKHRTFNIKLDGVKTMTLAGNLTGDAVATYGPRQGIFPSQKVNFRDLIPTLNTETGLYVFYRETATTNNFGFQQEGCLKGENSYMLSEVKVVQNYLAGTTTFSKQMATSLPWLTTTLPRLLMRDFFKKENASFYATVIAAATTDTTVETNKVKKLVDYITGQLQLNYNASFVIVSYDDMGALIKATFDSGYYSGAGGVILNSQANGMNIMGVPIIAAAWATTGTALVIDNDMIERVQAKGLSMELSYENNDNFTRNMITAKLECQEEINLLLAQSAAKGTL